MTSPPPLLFDSYYHIYNRGTNGENIFLQERNYEHFMRLYARYIEPITDTFAYCLLRNHFHLLVRVKSEEEMLNYMETLRVFSANPVHDKQERLAKKREQLPKKPLGSEHESELKAGYASSRFSDFFNAYAKAINNA